MTRPDLDAIEARADAATPGPWNLSADRETITQTSHVTRDVWTIPRTHEDMELIAAARTDIPTIVAYARELEATLLNERGLGDPPVEGWEPYLHNGRVRWSRELADGVYDIVREASDAPGWIHRHRHLAGHVTGTDGHPTARAAMRAASVPA